MGATSSYASGTSIIGITGTTSDSTNISKNSGFGLIWPPVLI